MWRITIIELNLIEIHHKVTHLLCSQLILEMWVDDGRSVGWDSRVNTIFNYCNHIVTCRWDTHHLTRTLGHISGHHPEDDGSEFEWLTSDMPRRIRRREKLTFAKIWTFRFKLPKWCNQSTAVFASVGWTVRRKLVTHKHKSSITSQWRFFLLLILLETYQHGSR